MIKLFPRPDYHLSVGIFVLNRANCVFGDIKLTLTDYSGDYGSYLPGSGQLEMDKMGKPGCQSQNLLRMATDLTPIKALTEPHGGLLPPTIPAAGITGMYLKVPLLDKDQVLRYTFGTRYYTHTSSAVTLGVELTSSLLEGDRAACETNASAVGSTLILPPLAKR
jgi:hypothetical protein